MIKLLIYIGLFYLGYRSLKSLFSSGLSNRDDSVANLPDDVMIKDPFCGVYFSRKEGVCLEMDGQSICFCSSKCRDRFLGRSPDQDG